MATQQSGLVSGNKQNAPGGRTLQSRSRFPESYSFFQTERFAEYFPFYVMEGVSDDILPLHSNHEVQTYNLKSPILQSLTKKKDYFAVPMQAILPLNWEKFYTNPNIGQDVPSDSGLGVANFWSKMRTLFINSYNALPVQTSQSVTAAVMLERWLKFFIFFERIYSCGSLMESLGISGHNWCVILYDDQQSLKRYVSIDEMFDDFVGSIDQRLLADESRQFTITISGVTYVVKGDPGRSLGTGISLRMALELIRENMDFTIGTIAIGTGTPVEDIVSRVSQDYDPTTYMPTSDAPLNLGRLWAYQLVCAHFYSNDHVDFIYSAELFRQYITQLTTKLFSGQIPYEIVQTFSVNGFDYQYDSLSSHIFDVVLSGFNNSGIFGWSNGSGQYGGNTIAEAYGYFTALFGFCRSLRFMDYFTGSRSLPLAVGDHNAIIGTDVAGKLDIVELARASMMTKFLQAVNRSGRKFSNYMKELFGKNVAYDYHNPMFLAHTSDLVGAQETENTGPNQMTSDIAVTSRLRATSSRYAFEFTPDRDCIVIGLSYYDLPRVYTRATERQNFVITRFDMFNPYMQFIGDQDVYQAEIGTDTPVVTSGTAFSYTNRHMEYKQRFNQAAGGFLVQSTGLDHWIFSADELRRGLFRHIDPDFIRSYNSEIDKFYQALTGYSLGTYFHFIVRYDNRMDASRPMAYNPTISV